MKPVLCPILFPIFQTDCQQSQKKRYGICLTIPGAVYILFSKLVWSSFLPRALLSDPRPHGPGPTQRAGEETVAAALRVSSRTLEDRRRHRQERNQSVPREPPGNPSHARFSGTRGPAATNFPETSSSSLFPRS